MGEVWLRFTVGTLRRRRIVGYVVLTVSPFVGAVSFARGDDPFWVGPVFGLGAGLLAFLLVKVDSRPKYVVRDGVLVNGRKNKPLLVLAQASRVGVDVDPKSRGALAIIIDGIRILLGDSWVTSYYEPDGLRALAAGLAASPHPEAQQTANWLHYFAANPDRDSWP